VIALVGYYEPWWMQIAKALVIFFIVFNLVPIALVADRKVLGRFQHRYGPNRVGPFGAMQPIADIGKLIFKEQFRPRTAEGWLFALAPVISIRGPVPPRPWAVRMPWTMCCVGRLISITAVFLRQGQPPGGHATGRTRGPMPWVTPSAGRAMITSPYRSALPGR